MDTLPQIKEFPNFALYVRTSAGQLWPAPGAINAFLYRIEQKKAALQSWRRETDYPHGMTERKVTNDQDQNKIKSKCCAK